MPHVEFAKAKENDFYEVVDFINYVFSRSDRPHDFETLLPAQYKFENFMTGTNYVAKEDGKVVANVGAYPAACDVCGAILKVAGITTVSVHPRTRSKGYMRKLMDMALEDMRNDGTALSFLMGQRQRYEYFGYTPCGALLNFRCRVNNIRHHFHNAFEPRLTVREISTGDTRAYDAVYDMYNRGIARVLRPRGRFADILGTWGDKTVGIYAADALIGYFSASHDYGSICEVYMDDPGLLAEALGVYLDQYKINGVSVELFPSDTAYTSPLEKLADFVCVNQGISYNVIDYPAVLGAFLTLKSRSAPLPDGELTVGIRDMCNVTISVSGNCPSAALTAKTPDAEFSHIEAQRFFFSPQAAYIPGPLDGNVFARCVLPAPIFIRKNDLS